MPQYDPVARKVYVNLQDENIFAVIDPATDEVVGGIRSGGAKETTDDLGPGASPGLPFLRRKRLDDRVDLESSSDAFLPMAGGPDVSSSIPASSESTSAVRAARISSSK